MDLQVTKCIATDKGGVCLGVYIHTFLCIVEQSESASIHTFFVPGLFLTFWLGNIEQLGKRVMCKDACQVLATNGNIVISDTLAQTSDLYR